MAGWDDILERGYFGVLCNKGVKLMDTWIKLFPYRGIALCKATGDSPLLCREAAQAGLG